MCDPVSAAMGMQVAGGAMGAMNARAQGKMEAAYYNYQADKAERMGKDLDKATQKNIGNIEGERDKAVIDNNDNYDQLEASQSAAMAANGVYADSGTNQQLIQETVEKRKIDEMAIRLNADNEIYQERVSNIQGKANLYTEATNMRLQAGNARKAAKLQMVSSLAGGATQAVSTYAGSRR